MNSTQQLIRHLALMLILAFPTLATGSPVVAECKGMQATATHSCCVQHPAACACNTASQKPLQGTVNRSHCGVNDCSCALHPAPESAPAPLVSVEPFFPAILVSAPGTFARVADRPILPVTAPNQSAQDAVRSSSSPRAPPFQG